MSHSGFLRSEKIHRPRPGLHPRTSDPVASMKITGPSVSTPSLTPARDVLTVKQYVAIDRAQLTKNFDRRYALCIQKLSHRPHFIVGGCWNTSLHVKPLQRCNSENSGSPARACVMRRQYSITYTQSIHTRNGFYLWDECETYFVDAPRTTAKLLPNLNKGNFFF